MDHTSDAGTPTDPDNRHRAGAALTTFARKPAGRRARAGVTAPPRRPRTVLTGRPPGHREYAARSLRNPQRTRPPAERTPMAVVGRPPERRCTHRPPTAIAMTAGR